MLKNCGPNSLFSICSKTLERVIYNTLFNYFVSNKLFTPSQSGSLPADSCITQRLSKIREIHTNFDNNPPLDVRGVFLNISKSFDKVWHEGLLFKLNSYEVDLISLLECYLTNRKQRFLLKVQTSDRRKINFVMPQRGTGLDPLLYLMYQNNLPEGIISIYLLTYCINMYCINNLC